MHHGICAFQIIRVGGCVEDVGFLPCYVFRPVGGGGVGGDGGPVGFAGATDGCYGPVACDGGFADAGAEEAVAAGYDEALFCWGGGHCGRNGYLSRVNLF